MGLPLGRNMCSNFSQLFTDSEIFCRWISKIYENFFDELLPKLDGIEMSNDVWVLHVKFNYYIIKSDS